MLSLRRALGRRCLSTGAEALTPEGVTLGDLLGKAKPVVTLGLNESAQQAAEYMTSKRASTLFVQDRGLIVGIVKEKSLIQLAGEGSLAEARVQDVMQTDVRYGLPSSSVRESLALLNESKQDHLPVVSVAFPGEPIRLDGSEPIRVLDVASLVSAKHIIGQFYHETIGCPTGNLSAKERKQYEAEAEKSLKLPTVKDLMKTKLAKSEAKGVLGTMVLNTLVEDEISVAEAICQMNKFDKGSVAVMGTCRDVPVLQGIITEQDIVRRVLGVGRDPAETLVVDIMTSSNLATVNSKETLLACAFKMVDANVRHLPVVSPKGSHILAMVSSKDVVAYFCEAWDH